VTDLGVALSKTVKAARLKRGMTQRMMIQRMGSSNPRVLRSYITKLETGTTRPTLETLERVADALDTTVSTLIFNAERRLTCSKAESVGREK